VKRGALYGGWVSVGKPVPQEPQIFCTRYPQGSFAPKNPKFQNRVRQNAIYLVLNFEPF
jgi:hypothetical protein